MPMLNRSSALLIGLFAAFHALPLPAADWDRFRGPNGSGVFEAERLPVEFGKSKNIAWVSNMSPGKSSPVLTDTRIFLTGHEDQTLWTICVDRASGREIWRRAAPSRRLERMNKLNDEASPTPVTDGKNVYSFFAGFGLLAYNADGDLLWKLPLGPFTNFHGMGASPILADGKLIVVCDQDLDAFVMAVDPADGEILWKQPRPDVVHSFSTPIVYQPATGPLEVVVPGSYVMISYAADGDEVWRVGGLTYQVKSGPVIGGDQLYFNGWAPGGEPSVRLELPAFEEVVARLDKDGDRQLSKDEVLKDWHPGNWPMHDRDENDLLSERDWEHYRARRVSENSTMAIRLGGRGDVSSTHRTWRYQKSLPDVASPLLYRDVLYLVKNGGIVTALSPATGEVLKQGRLRQALEGYYASPVAGDGKVFMASDAGKISVLEAGANWNVLATNDLAEPIYATPAIGDNSLYVRTATQLYCFRRGAYQSVD